uniref:Uncharacterized protein n=1 Tax=viral metagenome TaxID=1070528 RepID=A0A6C0C4V5_9ZZZZ
MQTFGSRRQVFNGNALKTNGGLSKKNLRKNKHGRIVSVRASKSARKHNNLKKAGWTAKKGSFGAVKISDLKRVKKSKSKSRKRR